MWHVTIYACLYIHNILRVAYLFHFIISYIYCFKEIQNSAQIISAQLNEFSKLQHFKPHQPLSSYLP